MQKIEGMDLRALVEEIRQKTSGIENDPKRAGELELERKAKEEKEWLQLLEKSGIEKRYRYCTFENIKKQGIPRLVEDGYRRAKYYADGIQEHADAGMGLALLGTVGTMKTSLAVAVLQAGLKAGISGMFITMPSLLDTLFTLKDTNREEWANYERRLRTVGILLLDDLGAEHTEGWVHTKIDAIVSERYNRMKPILITSNLTGERLEKTYAARIYDRIKQTSEVIRISGDSLRKARGA